MCRFAICKLWLSTSNFCETYCWQGCHPSINMVLEVSQSVLLQAEFTLNRRAKVVQFLQFSRSAQTNTCETSSLQSRRLDAILKACFCPSPIKTSLVAVMCKNVIFQAPPLHLLFLSFLTFISVLSMRIILQLSQVHSSML